MKFLSSNLNLYLVLVLFLAIVLRVYQINKIPSGFFTDEAAIGYNAFLILTTGKDEHGVSFPIFFQSFGDYKHPLAIYSTIPFILLFKLTVMAVRLNSVFYGLITIITLYFIGKEFISKKFGLWVVLIASTMPWLIHYNRIGFELNTYTTLFTISFLFSIKSIKNKLFIIPMFLSVGLMFYTYQSAKLIVPLFILGISMILKKTLVINKKEFLIGLIIFLTISIPLFLHFKDGKAFKRFNDVSIFSQHLSNSKIINQIILNYTYVLSPSYFIKEGDITSINRHFTRGYTPLLIITFPFLLIGLVSILKNIKQKVYQILVFSITIYPLASLFTGPPFSSRDIIGAPLFSIIIAFGIQSLVIFLSKKFSSFIIKFISTFIAFLIFFNLLIFFNFYFFKYPLYSSDWDGWQYGYEEIMTYFKMQEKNYDSLLVTHRYSSGEELLNFYNVTYKCKKCKVMSNPITISKKKELFALREGDIEEAKMLYPNRKFTVNKIFYLPNGNKEILIGIFQ